MKRVDIYWKGLDSILLGCSLLGLSLGLILCLCMCCCNYCRCIVIFATLLQALTTIESCFTIIIAAISIGLGVGFIIKGFVLLNTYKRLLIYDKEELD